MINARYRVDYAGEFVVLESKWSGGRKTQTREWIANPIENQHISGRAACIASDVDKHKFNFSILKKHRGGLLGSKKLQTYGASSITDYMILDFTVESKAHNLVKFIENNYYDANIVYTSARNCIANPGYFYIVPLRPMLTDIALLPYLAAFDGHKEIFLLGYNRDTPIDEPMWANHVSEVIAGYPGTKFYFVGEATNLFPQWLEHSNVETFTYQQFITYCDV